MGEPYFFAVPLAPFPGFWGAGVAAKVFADKLIGALQTSGAESCGFAER
jgi:hypothetical protein